MVFSHRILLYCTAYLTSSCLHFLIHFHLALPCRIASSFTVSPYLICFASSHLIPPTFCNSVPPCLASFSCIFLPNFTSYHLPHFILPHYTSFHLPHNSTLHGNNLFTFCSKILGIDADFPSTLCKCYGASNLASTANECYKSFITAKK